MFTPSDDILKKYADVLIRFALNSGQGIKPGEVVLLSVPEAAKPLLSHLQAAVLEAGGHYITSYVPDEIDRRTIADRQLYENASEQQLTFFPAKYFRGLVDQIDHQVAILADANPQKLEGIPSQRIMSRQSAMKLFWDWRGEKEYAGKFTWTLALYGTPAMAGEAHLNDEEYWQQIIAACFLDHDDPINQWRLVFTEIDRVKQRLNQLNINKLHIEAEDADLWITLGKNRQWVGGSGRNIPSFELFTSPDCYFTQGHIRFNQPLYAYGNLVEGIKLTFKQGCVIKVEASKGQDVLEEMIKVKNANRVGEFSLTDGRMSKITKYMANTLFDENVGGQFGNTHIALGSSYKDAYDGDPQTVKKEQWEKLGFNDSAVHTDIMATTDRTVTAELADGTEKVIYEHGQFTV